MPESFIVIRYRKGVPLKRRWHSSTLDQFETYGLRSSR